MRHFATESGKSKGQFYTPAEVSRRPTRPGSMSRSTGRRRIRPPAVSRA
ncbi:SAM-dependent methyltransferase [Mesorhizobium sp. M0815]